MALHVTLLGIETNKKRVNHPEAYFTCNPFGY